MVAPERVIRSFESASQLAAERVDVFPEEGAIRKLMEILELRPTALVIALVTLQCATLVITVVAQYIGAPTCPNV